MAHELTDGQGLQVMRCALGDASYGLEMRRVRSILRSELLEHRSDSVGGDYWLPAQAGGVAVWSLNDLLGQPDHAAHPRRDDGARRVVLLDADSLPTSTDQPTGPWGLLVDGVSKAVWVPEADLRPLPLALLGRAASPFEAVVQSADELFLLLCLARLRPDTGQGAAVSDSPTSRPPDALSEHAEAPRPPLPALTRGRPRSPGRIVVFALPSYAESSISFALSVTEVAEVIDLPHTLPVPGAPDFVVGLAPWRGEVIPVIDLAARLGLPRQLEPGKARLLVAHCRGPDSGVPRRSAHFGFPVPPSVRMVRLPAAAPAADRALPFSPRFTRGIFELQDGPLVVLDPGQLLR